MRIRTIKPEFWTNPKIGRLKRDERLLFLGLLNLADDQGVFSNNAALIKAQLFAYDKDLRESSVEAWLKSLTNARLIVPFAYKTEGYYVIRSFKEHQVINRPSKPKFPEELIDNILNVHENAHGVLTEYSLPEIGKERKGKEDIINNISENFPEISTDTPGTLDSDSETRKKAKEPPSLDAVEFAQWFRTQIPKDQKVVKADLTKWAYAYDDMIRIDKRPPDQIRAVCAWGRQDDFWKGHLLSPISLRQKNKSGVMKYDTILTQMNNRNGNSTGVRKQNNQQFGTDPIAKQRRINEILGSSTNSRIGNPGLAIGSDSQS